jgi:hypothetical protein
MSDDVTAALDQLSRVIVSAVRSEAVLTTGGAHPDLVKQLVVARIAAMKELQLLSEEEATLLVSSLDSPQANAAAPPVVTPDGELSLCGVLYSLIHRSPPKSVPGTPDDITVSISDSVALGVCGAMAGLVYGGGGAIFGAGIGGAIGAKHAQ